MRFLADENFPRVAVVALRRAEHDVAWVLEDRPGMTDGEVLARALDEERTLLTFDKDFGALAFARGEAASHGVILFRTIMPAEDVWRFVVATIDSRDDWKNCFSTVEVGRVRMRPLPRRPKA